MPDDAPDPQQAQELQALADSGIFDAAWYAANNADVAHGGDDPARHFVSRGWREGRVSPTSSSAPAPRHS